uniref:CSON009607 protein n=1 Tax=Culicoides sonorensis TaxID=179676 RepID=A0A336M176_CULSO
MKMMNLSHCLTSTQIKCLYYLSESHKTVNLKRKYEEFTNYEKTEVSTTTTTTTTPLSSTSSPVISPAKRTKLDGYYVKLANESPQRQILETDLEDGYSTVHDIETEECRDSDDTESLSVTSERTTGYATIDVLEYEIATTSEDEDSLDNASFCTESTGSDSLYLQSLAVQALYETSTDDDYIQADTEDSQLDSDSADPELGKADYWECVKCKNKQNNPLYRYCERCYQVRKSHFPPRPKTKKLRQRRRSNRSKPYSTKSGRDRDASSISCSDDESLETSSPVKLNSSSSSMKGVKRKSHSDDDDSRSSSSGTEIDDDEPPQKKRGSPKRRYTRNSHHARDRKNTTILLQDCAKEISLGLNSVDCVDGSDSKLSVYHSQLKESTNQIQINVKNKHLTQHDSGISSQEVGSSQEFFSSSEMTTMTMQPAMLKRTHAKSLLSEINCNSSTEEHDADLIRGKNSNIKPSPLSATSSNCSEASIESGVSSISHELDSKMVKREFNNKQQQQLNSNNKDFEESMTCSLCFDNEKSAVFVHTKKACSGCCYTCAMKTWKKYKNCPFCKEKAKNVIKLYSH